jgi:hypothetical protein
VSGVRPYCVCAEFWYAIAGVHAPVLSTGTCGVIEPQISKAKYCDVDAL